MPARLTQYALSQRLLLAAMALALCVAGAMAYRTLPIDAFPDVSPTQVKVILKAPGMTPTEVESRIIVPLEQELLGIPNQSVLRAVAKYGIADLTLDFSDGTDVYWARQQVAERFASVLPDLPESTTGGLAPLTTPLGDMYMFTVEGPQSLAERRAVLDWVVRPQLRTLPGVADVNALGGVVRTYEVVPDIAALAAAGITLPALADAIAANNRSDGAGRVSRGEESLLIRVDAGVRSLSDVQATPVSERSGRVVRVADVAEVREGALTRYGAVTSDGKGETVEGIVLALRGANARDVVARVRARIAEITPTLPTGMRIVPFYDRSELVNRATGTVARALAEAAVLVVVLLVVFLGNLRAALVVTLLLPLSALATFIAMRQLGLSANLMSLGGLAIAIGMLVDAGVVVVENIVAHDAHPHTATGAPEPGNRLQRLHRSVAEVASPVVAGVVIIAVVFLPLLTLEGLEGKLFRPVAITIVIALASSLLLSLTVVPVLASWLLRDGGGHAEPWIVQRLQSGFARVFDRLLAHDRWVFAGAGVLLASALITYPFLGKSFIPTLDEGGIIMQLQKLPSITLEESLRIDLAVQAEVLRKVPEVQRMVARSGSDELGLDPMGLNETDSFLELRAPQSWRADKAAIVDDLRSIGATFPGLVAVFTQPIEMRVAEMLTGTRGDLAVKVYGPDLATLDLLATQIRDALRAVPGAEDVAYARNDGVQYLQVDLDRTSLGAVGIDAATVQRTLRALVEGERVGVALDSGRRVPIVLRGDPHLRADAGALAAAPIGAGADGAVTLSSVANLHETEGPVKVERENASRFAVVQSNVRGRDLVGFVADARAAVSSAVSLPAGYRLAWGGQFENQQRAAARLAVVIPVALALIVLLLILSLGSARQALLVFANVPFALVGGVLALAVTGEYLSVPASVGFIALMGIAVLNGLVLVTQFKQLAREGLPELEVVRVGTLRRLRPVLMTALITAFGLVPLLFATGPGSEIQRPLAVVVIGGVVSSTLLTLVMLPLLFRRFCREIP